AAALPVCPSRPAHNVGDKTLTRAGSTKLVRPQVLLTHYPVTVMVQGQRLNDLRAAVAGPREELVPVGGLAGEKSLGVFSEVLPPGLGIVVALLLHDVAHGESSQRVGGAPVVEPDGLQLEQTVRASCATAHGRVCGLAGRRSWPAVSHWPDPRGTQFPVAVRG